MRHMTNLSNILTQAAATHPTKTAIIAGDTELDYATVDLLARMFAGALRDRGVQPGEHVAHMREHLYSLATVREELAPWFDLGEPVPGAYLYRWPYLPERRDEEERLIAAGELPAVGCRFIAIRR